MIGTAFTMSAQMDAVERENGPAASLCQQVLVVVTLYEERGAEVGEYGMVSESRPAVRAFHVAANTRHESRQSSVLVECGILAARLPSLFCSTALDGRDL
jgi:hypothetical protein